MVGLVARPLCNVDRVDPCAVTVVPNVESVDPCVVTVPLSVVKSVVRVASDELRFVTSLIGMDPVRHGAEVPFTSTQFVGLPLAEPILPEESIMAAVPEA
jgi:hypothetical protein